MYGSFFGDLKVLNSQPLGLESGTQPSSQGITQALAQLRVPKPGVSFGESDTRMLRLNKRQMESYAQVMLERIFYLL